MLLLQCHTFTLEMGIDSLVLQSVRTSNTLALKKSVFNNQFYNSSVYLLFKCILISELLQSSLRLCPMATIHVLSPTKHMLSRQRWNRNTQAWRCYSTTKPILAQYITCTEQKFMWNSRKIQKCFPSFRLPAAPSH